MKFRIRIEIIGDSGVVWDTTSSIISGEDAKGIVDLVNRLSELTQLSFPKDDTIIFLTRALLDRAIITVEEL